MVSKDEEKIYGTDKRSRSTRNDFDLELVDVPKQNSNSLRVLPKLDLSTERSLKISRSIAATSVFKDPYELDNTLMQSARTLPQK